MTKQELNRWHFLTVAPWVGNNFEKLDQRILLVGHSTYIENPNDYTDDEIRAWLSDDTEKVRNNTFTYKYWSNMLSAIRGSNFSDLVIRQDWDNYALINYIQRIQAPGLHQANEEDYTNAHKMFREAVSELKPTSIIFFTAQAFDDLRNREGKPLGDRFTINCSGVVSDVLRLTHPSWYFSWSRAHEKIEAFLNE